MDIRIYGREGERVDKKILYFSLAKTTLVPLKNPRGDSAWKMGQVLENKRQSIQINHQFIGGSVFPR